MLSVFDIFRIQPVDQLHVGLNVIQPAALIYPTGSAEEMIANSSVLITRFSSTAYVGLALGKEVHSDFDIDDLRQKMPIQTGKAAEAIAAVCRRLMTGTEHAAYELAG